MLRRWSKAYFAALENETSVRWGAFLGVITVLSPAASVAITHSQMGDETQPAFYETAATVLPVLLLAYFFEHSTMTKSLAEKVRHRTQSDPLGAKQAQHLIDTSGPIAALTASSAATGEVLSLYAVATAETNAFLLMGTVVALGVAGISILMFAVGRIKHPA